MSRVNTVSPSIITTRSQRAAAIPALRAEGLPPFGFRITRTPGRASDSATSAVPSVEPSSTTITSTGWVPRTRDRIVSAMHSFSL